MSALGSLVVKLALDYAEYTQGLDRTSQEALKFAQNSQKSFDQAGNSAKEFLGNVAGNVAGAIASVVGLNAAFAGVRESINILDSLDETAQKTGSSIEDLSRIAKVARNFGDAFEPIEQAIVKLSKNLADIDNPSSDAIRALDAIGVSARDNEGKLRTSAAVYIDVARALQGYEDGNQKAAVATALFGKSGAELLPAINNLAQGIGDVTAISDEYTRQAGLFNDQVARGKARVNELYESMAVELLPTLNIIAAAVNNSSSQFDVFSFASNAAKVVLKGLAIAGYTVVDMFNTAGRGLGAWAARVEALARLDFEGVRTIGQAFAEDNKKSVEEYRKFFDTVMNGEKQIASAIDNGGTKKALEFQLNLPPAIDRTTQSLEKQGKAFDMELYKLRQYQDDAKRARDITASVATQQEQYNQKLEELERLKPYLSVETYSRALQKAQDELGGVKDTAQKTFNDIDQYAVQASRNIQTSLANFLFDPFDDGLKGMVQGVANAARRMLAEFAAMRISNAIGLSSLFGLGSSAASASAGATGAGGGLNLLNVASAGSGLMNLFKGGFGATSLLSSVGGMLPGSAGAFFSGMGGGAIAGVSSPAALAGASFAPILGPAVALFAADAITRMIAGDKTISNNGIWKAVSSIPVIGIVPNLINALFGRGPLKQKETSLTGAIGLDGFESGMLQARFEAKGGLFRSNKTDFARVDAVTGEIWTDNQKQLGAFAQGLSKASKEIFGAFNDTAKQTSETLKQVGMDLGLSNDALAGFSYQINLVSEKGKMLTEEQIGKEIENMTEAMARKLLPTVDDFAKRGETALQTISRLGAEFNSLSDAVSLIFGKSSADAKAMISGTSFAGRTAFVDAAGGTDALAQKAAFFSQNFFTSTELLTQSQTRLDEQLQALGLSSDLTKDQFRGLVQSFGQVGGISEDLLQSMLNLAPSFVSVRAAEEQLAAQVQQQRLGLETQLLQLQGNTVELRRRELEALDPANRALQENIYALIDQKAAAESSAAALKNNLTGAFSDLQKSVAEEKTRITDAYNKAVEESQERINGVTASIGKLKSLSDALKSTVDQIQPLSRDQAKYQILSAINAAKLGGGLPDADSLRNALGVLGNSQNVSGFSSSFDFAREQAKTANLITELGDITGSKLSTEQQNLSALEDARKLLDDGFKQKVGRLDGLLEQGQQQIDALSGINSGIFSLAEAIGRFNTASIAAGGGSISGGYGNRIISNQDIIDYFKVPHTPSEIARDAGKYGVTSQQIIATGRFTQADADKFFLDNPDIPRFAAGGFHRGGLRIVGERGPELERTGPSSITSNGDLKELLGNRELINQLKKLISEMEENTKFNERVSNKLDALTVGGNTLRVKQVS